MPAGVQIISSAGTVQIDENYRNLFVRASGVGGTVPAKSNFDKPMLALARGSRGGGYFGQSLPAGTKWWVFDLMPLSMATGFGLQVYTSAGLLVYDAGQKPLRIVAANVGNGTHTYAAGREYATIIQSAAARWTEGAEKAGDTGWEIHEKMEHGGTSVSGNQVSVGLYTVRDEYWFSDFEEYPQGERIINSPAPTSVLVVDVTHY